MAILVTGGNGFLGSYVIENLQRKGEKVVSFDIVEIPVKLSNLIDTKRIKFSQGDIQNIGDLIRTIKEEDVDRIIHTPAILTAMAQQNPALAFRVNIGGTLNVLEAARIMKIRRGVVFVSSHVVYGDILQENTPEEHPKNPASVYGVTKLTSEHFGLQYSKEFGVDFIALRFPLIYGWRAGQVKGLAILSEMIEKSWRGVPITLTANGGMERKFLTLYVKDAAKAIVLATFKEQIGNRIFNIGSGEVLRLGEIVEIIREVMPQSKIIVVEGEDGANIVKGSLDLSKAYRELDYKTDYLFKEGVKDYISYLESA